MAETTLMLACPPGPSAIISYIEIGRLSPPVEVIYRSHERWPFPLGGPVDHNLRIMVLDASFNPPTKAHRALAIHPRPTTDDLFSDGKRDYDARLLLLSIRNADKMPSTEDASYFQRIEMMRLMAEEIMDEAGSPKSELDPSVGNLAVAIIDEPTFVGKSRTLTQYFKERLGKIKTPEGSMSEHFDIQLSFVMGFDTFERMVDIKYYDSNLDKMYVALDKLFAPDPYGDNSLVVCASRVSPDRRDDRDLPDRITIAKQIASRYTDTRGLFFIEIGQTERTYSSTAVRKLIRQRGIFGLRNDSWRRMVPGDVADYITGNKMYPKLDS